MAPKRLLAGETESGCLSLHNLELPAHVLLELVPTIENQVLARTSAVVKTGKYTCKLQTKEYCRRNDNLQRITCTPLLVT